MGCTALLYLNLARTPVSDASLRYLGRLVFHKMFPSVSEECSRHLGLVTEMNEKLTLTLSNFIVVQKNLRSKPY